MYITITSLFTITEQLAKRNNKIEYCNNPNTVLSETKKPSSEHIATVHQFFEDAVTNNYMVALFIDDFHNIHSHHRPSSSSQLKYAI